MLNAALNFLKTPTFFIYLSQASNIFLTFFIAWVATNYASLTIYGYFLALTSLSQLLGNLLGFRTNEAVVKFLKIALTKNNLSMYRMSLLFGIFIDTLVASIIFLTFYLTSDVISATLLGNDNLNLEINKYALFSSISILAGVSLGYLTANEKFRTLALLTISVNLAKVLFILSYIISGKELNLDYIVTAHLYASFIFIFPLLRIYYIVFIKLHKHAIFSDTQQVKNFASFSLKTFISSLLKSGNQGIDNLAVTYFISAESLGIYGLIKKFFSPLHFIVAPYTTIWYPKFVQAFESGPSEVFLTIKRLTKSHLNLIFLLPIISFLCIFYLQSINTIVTASIIYTMVLCGLANFLQSFLWWARPFGNTVNPNYSISINLICSFISIISLIIFIPYLNIVGAALSILIVNIVAYLYWVRKLNLLK